MEAADQAGAGAEPAVQQQASEAAKAAAAAAPVGFAKRKTRGNIRKRAADEEEGEGGGGDDGGGVVRKAARQKDAPLGFTTKRTDRAELFAFESSKALQQQQSDAFRSNEQETAHDRDGRWVALQGQGCREVHGGSALAAQLLLPSSCHLPAGQGLCGRQAAAHWRTHIAAALPHASCPPCPPASLVPRAPPAPSLRRALREQVLAQTEGGAPVSGEDGAYRGLNSYRDYRAGFRREQTIGAEKGAGAHGPLRASTNVRMTVRVDYQPDICKDYKETGYCGFGDACKFMHDRGDYKQGWELDRVRGATCAGMWWGHGRHGRHGRHSARQQEGESVAERCNAGRKRQLASKQGFRHARRCLNTRLPPLPLRPAAGLGGAAEGEA